jgi:hypothetical protein
MPAANPVSTSTAENLITLLCHNDEHGKLVASLVTSQLFENEIHRNIVTRVLEYWKKYKKAPKLHTPDLFADILEDENNRKAPTYRNVFTSMAVLSYSGEINAEYVLNEVRQHIRTHEWKRAVLTAAEKLQSKQQLAVPELEEMFADLARARPVDFEMGITLADYQRVLDFLANRSTEFMTGIIPLDKGGIIPARKAAMLMLAGPGRGKTWFLVKVGKHNIQQRKKVLHLSLELVEEQVTQRYYQALFGIPRHMAERHLKLPQMTIDRFNRFSAYEKVEHDAEWALDSDEAGTELEAWLDPLGKRIENLIVKSFPMRKLMVDGIARYLDQLKLIKNWEPDIVILDYLGIMKTDAKDHRISLGRTFEEFRGLMVERNMAGVCAHQLSKKGAESIMAGSQHVSEDYSLIATADNALVYSSTNAERNLGLGRLFVDKAREAKDKWGVLLTQAYEIGQFAIDAVRLDNRYFEYLNTLREREEAPDEERGRGRGR